MTGQSDGVMSHGVACFRGSVKPARKATLTVRSTAVHTTVPDTAAVPVYGQCCNLSVKAPLHVDHPGDEFDQQPNGTHDITCCCV